MTARLAFHERFSLDPRNEFAGAQHLMFRAVIFFSLAASAFASQTLDALISAAANFSAAIQQQLEAVESDPSPIDFARNTIAYAQAKMAYFAALREEMPALINIATGRQARPLEMGKIAAVFSIAGERQETIADRGTLALLKRFSGNSDVEKARVEFERARELRKPSIWISMDKTSLFLFAHDLLASLSVRSPRKTGCRSWPSLVHSVNLTWATSTGSTQLQRFMTAGVIP